MRNLPTGEYPRAHRFQHHAHGKRICVSTELIDSKSDETVRSHSERSYGEGRSVEALNVIAADVRRDFRGLLNSTVN
jgi:hypothetical protein